MYFQTVTAKKFQQALTNAWVSNPHIETNVSLYTQDQMAGFHLVLTVDGLSGFAIKPDGELTAVFSAIKGRGKSLVAESMERGATHLNAFEGHLTKLYSACGFKEYNRSANWTPGGPDVVFMSIDETIARMRVSTSDGSGRGEEP